MRKLALLFVILLASGVLHAEETAKDMLVKMSGQISDEYSACAAFFDVASQVMEVENKAYQKKYQALKRDSIEFAIGFAKMDQSIESAEKRVTESYKSAMYRMDDVRKQGREPFAELIKEQSAYCPRLMEDPTVVMERI